MRGIKAVVVVVLMAAALGACGEDEPTATPEETTTSADTETELAPVAIDAVDYGFEVSDTIKGGLVEMQLTNSGKEAHFAGLAKVAEGKTYEDAKAALTAAPSGAPPAGPPPFEEFAGVATVDPDGVGNGTFNLPAGTYALFCTLPAPDGIPHAAKGMIRPLTVTEGLAAGVPRADTTLSATDFSLAGAPPAKAGTGVVKIRNQGKQLHEVNLVELMPDKTLDDLVAWFKAPPAGPPPASFRSGVAVKPGEEGTTEFTLDPGVSYAIICAVPDSLSGDFVPHIAKGMYTAAFTVS